MPTLTIFDFYNPKIRVKSALTQHCGIHIGLWPLGQFRPYTRIGHKIERTLKYYGLPIQRVELDQNGAASVIAMCYDKGWHIRQPKSRQIGIHPESRGQSRHGFPRCCIRK